MRVVECEHRLIARNEARIERVRELRHERLRHDANDLAAWKLDPCHVHDSGRSNKTDGKQLTALGLHGNSMEGNATQRLSEPAGTEAEAVVAYLGGDAASGAVADAQGAIDRGISVDIKGRALL